MRRYRRDRQTPAPQCPFCFVAAQSAGHVATAGEAPAFPAYAGLLVATISQPLGDGTFVPQFRHRHGEPRAPPAVLRLTLETGFASAELFTHALTENIMRTFSKLAFAALLIGFAAPALAQGAGSTSITVEQPWSRATPNGAKTGAVYMTIDNKSGTADRLTGAVVGCRRQSCKSTK